MILMGLNLGAKSLVDMLLQHPGRYGVEIHERAGATLIDAGVETMPGIQTGILISRICLGDACQMQLGYMDPFPELRISMDAPLVALWSQLAGWRITSDKFKGYGSGPARILAGKPKWIFQKYPAPQEPRDFGILFLESESLPDDAAVKTIAHGCGLDPEKLYLVVSSAKSLPGMIQILARVIEVGLLRLDSEGMDLTKIHAAFGAVPIPPLGENSMQSMGLANDFIQYGGVVWMYSRDHPELESIVKRCVFSSTQYHGSRFLDLLKQADYDFYKLDPKVFSPAQLILSTGSGIYAAGMREIKKLRAWLGI